MEARMILLAYLVLACLDLCWGLFLAILNHRSVKAGGGRAPAELEGRLSAEEALKARDYSLARLRFGLIESPVTTAVTLVAAGLGLFGLLDGFLWDRLASPFLRAALFFALIALASAILSAPFSLWSAFRLEKRFGFNTMTLRTWMLDGLKSALLSALLGLPLLWLLFSFMDAAGGLWWLWAAAIFSVIDVVLSLLYPLLIAPLFNKFRPLPEGSLAEGIKAMAGRLGFRMSGIFVMDGSKRSRHSNAYFTGLGAVKRIVLFDTLVDSMGEAEVLAVLAHEIGHEKKRHVLKMTILSVALAIAGFYALSLLMSWGPLYEAFGFAQRSKEAILLIFGLVAGPATFFVTPLFSAWSRRHEFEADRYAAEAAGPEAMSSALLSLSRENASNLWPHPLYSAWYYSHPTLVERLRAVARTRPGQAAP